MMNLLEQDDTSEGCIERSQGKFTAFMIKLHFAQISSGAYSDLEVENKWISRYFLDASILISIYYYQNL